MIGKTALVFGATGLVGGEVLRRILQDPSYSRVKIFVRRKPDFDDHKLEIFNFDINHLEKSEEMIYGNDLFCCLGTTIKKAGSQEAFKKVDFDGPVRLADIASRHGINSFLVISSFGADDKSSNFYLRIKGEMESAIKNYKFRQLAILRPFLLTGERSEFRVGEFAGKVIMSLVKPFLIGRLKRYRPINASSVAGAMLKIAASDYGYKTYESEEIQSLGSR